jgi:archaeoflavoprotein AfpA
MRVAWGLTGSGDKFRETYEIMRQIKDDYGESLKVHVYLSKAAEQVAKYYKLSEELHGFDRYNVELDANTPFLSGMLQTGRYDFLLIAPATSNTVAKIAYGISDTLITNAAVQGVKGFIDVYIMPVDFREGIVTTVTPQGKDLKLRVRKEDAENVIRMGKMEGFHVFENPEEIREIIKNRMIG